MAILKKGETAPLTPGKLYAVKANAGRDAVKAGFGRDAVAADGSGSFFVFPIWPTNKPLPVKGYTNSEKDKPFGEGAFVMGGCLVHTRQPSGNFSNPEDAPKPPKSPKTSKVRNKRELVPVVHLSHANSGGGHPGAVKHPRNTPLPLAAPGLLKGSLLRLHGDLDGVEVKGVDLMERHGWLAHTMRARIHDLRKRGFHINAGKLDGELSYKLIGNA